MGKTVIDGVAGLKSLVGKELGISDWRPMTYEAIRKFADATGDHQWIHLDRDRAAKESPYGTTIAHGFLTLSLLSHLSKQALQIQNGARMAVNYGLNRVRFSSPVHAGSKIRARFTLQSLRDVGSSSEAVFSIEVEGQNQSKPCCVAEWVVRYYAQKPPPPA